MGFIENMELNVLASGNYERYVEFLSSNRIYDVLRYAMAVSNSAQENLADEQVLFTGGVGVLGNLVDLLGEDVIPLWRRTHDVDLILRDRKYEGIIQGFFDELDVYCPSLSIQNKLTVRGRSFDSENLPLEVATMDVYHPKRNPKEGVNIHGQVIDSACWDRSLVSSFFGIPIRVLDPIDLISLKTRVVGKNSGGPREKDIRDIYDLIAISQRLGYCPRDISSRMGPKLVRRLEKLSPFLKLNNSFNPVLNVDQSYLEGIHE